MKNLLKISIFSIFIFLGFFVLNIATADADSDSVIVVVNPPAGCYQSPWGTIAHGASVPAYSSPTVPYGSSCSSQTRTCTNGSLSGSYTYSSCYMLNICYPVANPAGYGNACNSSPNSCNQTNSGTIQCNGSCSATTPANPAGYGNACNSSPNSCNQTNSGTIQCNGSCSATTPANPAGYGNACTSAPNACGQTNSGTIQCNGSCSATTPANTCSYTLTITKAGTGSGTVGGAGSYLYGSTATATASADGTSYFAGWSGDCNASGQVSMTTNRTCTATFTKIPVNCVGSWGACSGGVQYYSISTPASYGGTACPYTNGLAWACGTTAVCSGTHYGCSPGTSVNNASNLSTWTWGCNSTDGGVNVSSCSEAKPAPGAWITASPTSIAYGAQSTLTWGSTNATSCTATGPWSNSGTLSGSGLTNALTANTTFSFQCTGNGQTSALQSVTVGVSSLNGSCGTSNGGNFYSAPTSGYCNAGTYSGISGSGPWSWSCAGANGGTTASCSANKAIDGGWSAWSAKDNTPGYTGTQTRTCTNPTPAYGGAACVGDSTLSYTNTPVTPTGLAASASSCGNNWLNIWWNASSGATNYKVYRDGGTLVYNSNGTSFSDTGLGLASYHTYTVNASNAGGTSGNSSAVGATVSNACGTNPDIKSTTAYGGTNVDGPSETYAGDSISLSWAAVANAASCTLSGGTLGTIAASVSGGSQATTASALSQTYTLNCTNSTGQSASNSVTVTIPPPPITFTKTCNAAGDLVTLNWTLQSGYTGGYLRSTPWGTPPFHQDLASGLTTNVTVVPRTTYSGIYLHTRNSSNGAWSNPLYLTDFSCTPPVYTLTINKIGNGTGTVTGAGSYDNKTTVTTTAVAGTGSTFAGWDATCGGGTGNGSVYMNANKTCNATFTLTPYTLTIPASGGTGSGTYGGTAAGSVNYGTAVSITAAPSTGSTFTNWVTSGAAAACNNQTTSPCNFTMTGAASVKAIYGLMTGTLTPSATSCTIANGASTCTVNLTWSVVNPIGATTAITASGMANYNSPSVSGGGPTAFTVPYAGRTFFLYNNATLLAQTVNITASCASGVWNGTTCSQFTVTPSAGANGTISPSTPQTVNYNATTSFTVTPSAGYAASMSGTCGGNLVGNTYTTNAITASCTVIASFALNNYTVTASAGAGGTISPASKSVAHGLTATFNVIPNSGKSISVSGCGGSLSGNTYTTGAITTPCSVTASFSQLSYTLNYSAGANGTISGTASQNVNYGSNASAVTAVPNLGYHFESWSEGALHKFTSGTSAFTPPAGVTSVEALVVAGGGGGGSSSYGNGGAGGGGAGGLKYYPSLTITEGQPLSVTVGAGGISGIMGAAQAGSNGGNSSLGSITTTGGGYGAYPGGNGGNGGSGGGAGYNGYSSARSGGNAVSGEGYAGGATPLLSWAGAAGGGGAGGAGQDNKINHEGGSGGPGISYSISGTPVLYSRGGGGGSSTIAFSPANTGQGGDGSYGNEQYGAIGVPYAGGSGVVIVKYPITTATRQDTSVTSSKSPVATFAINTYTVTASAGAGGTISPASSSINHGSTAAFTVTPNVGYLVSVGGTCGGTLSGTTYTTSAIIANCTVVASFTQITLSVTATTPYNTIPGASVSFAYVPVTSSGSTECALLNNTQTVITPYQSASPIVYTIPSSIGSYGYYVKCRNVTSPTVTANSGLITVNTACSATTSWNGSICIAPSGSLSATNCLISAESNSCPTSLTWSTTYPIGISAVTTNPANTIVTNANSGTTTYAVPYGSRDFYLYNNSNQIGLATANATCTSGTTWNGTEGKCKSTTGTLDASGCTVASGASTCPANLSWTTTNPTTISILKNATTGTTITSGNSGSQTYPVSPGVTNFELWHNGVVINTASSTVTCSPLTQWNGSTCALIAPEIDTFSVSAGTIFEGRSATLTWTTNPSLVTSCSGTGFPTGGLTSGSAVVTPTATTTYTLTCARGAQTVVETLTVKVINLVIKEQ